MPWWLVHYLLPQRKLSSKMSVVPRDFGEEGECCAFVVPCVSSDMFIPKELHLWTTQTLDLSRMHRHLELIHSIHAQEHPTKTKDTKGKTISSSSRTLSCQMFFSLRNRKVSGFFWFCMPPAVPTGVIGTSKAYGKWHRSIDGWKDRQVGR